MIRFLATTSLAVGVLISAVGAAPATGGAVADQARPLLLAHYMPWYEAKPARQTWGWHWTMNHFNPDQQEGGRRQSASHYAPLIGLYDSGDPDVLQCQSEQMKLAGIDGVIIDWYGPDDHLDYGSVHRNSQELVTALKKAGLRFAVCYEDQSVPRLIEGKKVDPAQTVEHGRKVLRWLDQHWFHDPAYVRVGGKPLFMVYGPQFYKDDQWPEIFRALPAAPAYFTLHYRRGAAQGAFDWPQPAPNLGLAAVDTFYTHAREWPTSIPVAFPRFHDIYQEAGVGSSYGSIPDDGGKTYETTLKRALQSHSPIVQIATWNDWGEGTQIEPSEEFGYRDLEKTQTLRWADTDHPYTSSDLRVPAQVLQLRRMHAGNAALRPMLDRAARLLDEGKPNEARRAFAETKERETPN